ncbi:GTP-binding protein Rho1 [Cladochytrium tenue]|nr:GTP-binding protein Rho1 [Cladochytrium tenue]
MLIGTKTDLRTDPATLDHLRSRAQTPVSFEEGARVAAEVGAKRYFECSAKANDGVREIFEYAGKLVARSRRRRGRGGCVVM